MSALPHRKSDSFNLTETLLYGLAVAAAFVGIRTLLIQPFNIPSESMLPTLLVGDHIIVSKFSYGFSRYSVPFAPFDFSGRLLASPPERGDVVVFRARIDDEEKDLIKRIVGLPGDHIQMLGGRLHINGQPVRREQAPDFIGEGACRSEGAAPDARTRRWRETLPNGVAYETLDCMDGTPLDDTPVMTVPPERYFIMGDNRDESFDSRVPEPEGFGGVPFENLIGRAQVVYLSVQDGERVWMIWRWPWSMRWPRLFTVVR